MPSRLLAALGVAGVGAAMAAWHANVLATAPDVPAVALLGTTTLLALSVLLVGFGAWLGVGSAAPATAVRTLPWVAATVPAFGLIGMLVVLHLNHTMPGFDGAPLVADLVTVGAVVGSLLGVYDARGRQYRARMRTERDRFAALFEDLPNPGLHYELTGGDPVVRGANAAFERAFGVDATAARGRPVDDVLATDDAALRRRLRAGDAFVTETRLMAADGLRDFRLTVVPHGGTEGFWIGTDVTERKQRAQRLEVLNRVLRHDLRTDANVIAGTADGLPESAGGETVRERALAMVERGETARRVGRALDRTTDRRAVDLAALVRDRAARVEGATVHVDAEPAVAHGSDALGDAIEELLANAVEHGSTSSQPEADDAPTLWVTTGTDGRFATAAVADDGPGLPDLERRVLDAGRETDLEHSSGLGLWMVRWIVEDLGGEVVVGDRDPRGTVVRLRLPRADGDG